MGDQLLIHYVVEIFIDKKICGHLNLECPELFMYICIAVKGKYFKPLFIYRKGKSSY